MTRTICVSGSASGIGKALAERLRGTGHRVIGVDLHDADVVADLSSVDGRSAAVSEVLDQCDGRLDGLAALAGLGPQAGSVPQLRVNLFGAIALLDGLFEALRAGNAPAAVVASSIAATIAPVDEAIVDAAVAGDEEHTIELADKLADGGIAYSTSKRALAILTRRRAVEWIAAGVRLNALAPGNTMTPLTAGALEHESYGPQMRAVPVPRGDWAQPGEIAAAAAWALSPEASYLVGSFLVIDGGTDALVRPTIF